MTYRTLLVARWRSYLKKLHEAGPLQRDRRSLAEKIEHETDGLRGDMPVRIDLTELEARLLADIDEEPQP